MRICIVGAGAIGGYLGGKLALAGEQVTLIARGAHLEAIRTNGLTLVDSAGQRAVATPALATSDLREAGVQDVVIIAVKAHQLPAIAPELGALYGPDTAVVTAQNGIPWWYFMRHGGPYDGRRIESVDPQGLLEQHIPADRVIGCVVYPATALLAPGVIRHVEGDRFTLGELDGIKTVRVQQIAKAIAAAGLRAPVRPHIRSEIWLKLWGNLAFNPISAVTRATLIDIIGFAPTRELAHTMMAEGQAVAERLGIRFDITIEQRIAGAAQVGAHKTSMLQDVEAGRATEIDALVGAVAELGRLVGVPTPSINALYASVKLFEQQNTAKA